MRTFKNAPVWVFADDGEELTSVGFRLRDGAMISFVSRRKVDLLGTEVFRTRRSIDSLSQTHKISRPAGGSTIALLNADGSQTKLGKVLAEAKGINAAAYNLHDILRKAGFGMTEADASALEAKICAKYNLEAI